MFDKSTESLRFPSGRTIKQVRIDAKRLKKIKRIKYSEALNLCSRENGINADWNKAVQNILQSSSQSLINEHHIHHPTHNIDIQSFLPSILELRSNECDHYPSEFALKLLSVIKKEGSTHISEDGKYKVVRFKTCNIVRGLGMRACALNYGRVKRNLTMLMAQPESNLVAVRYEHNGIKESCIIRFKG